MAFNLDMINVIAKEFKVSQNISCQMRDYDSELEKYFDIPY